MRASPDVLVESFAAENRSVFRARLTHDATWFCQQAPAPTSLSDRSPLKTNWFSGRVSPCPSVRTIARLIADAPDKMRCIPQRLNAKGQTKRPFKRRCRARKPKHFKAQYPGALYRPGYDCALSARSAPLRLNGHQYLYPNGNSSGNQPL